LLTAPPNYLWQHALERLFPGRKPSSLTKSTLPRYEVREHDELLGEDGLQQEEEPETKLDWKNTTIKWLLDCMTLGALLNVTAFIILMGIMKGRSSSQIGNALRTVCTSTSSLLCINCVAPLLFLLKIDYNDYFHRTLSPSSMLAIRFGHWLRWSTLL
jgi:hypothetical protein